MNDLTLKQLWQQVAEKTNLEIKYKELCAQHSSVETRLKQLEKTRRAEQADVDRLEGRSLAAFFYQVIGRMDEKLDQERDQGPPDASEEQSGNGKIRVIDQIPYQDHDDIQKRA